MVLLVRYGEIALKSRYVRRRLEDLLAANVRDMFAANGVECVVRTERGRVFVHAEDEASGLDLLRRVFGIVSISPAKETSSTLDELSRFVARYAKGVLEPGNSFAIRARRSGQHPYSSRDLAVVLGRAAQDAIPGLRVDLDAPDVELHVEVRGRTAYVFHETVPGTGGMPIGSQGRVLARVEDENGLVAAWLVMRRGCRAIVIGVDGLVSLLRRWDPKLVVREPGLLAERLEVAAGARIEGIVASESIQATVRESRIDAPMLLRPLVGLSDQEVAALASAIRGT